MGHKILLYSRETKLYATNEHIAYISAGGCWVKYFLCNLCNIFVFCVVNFKESSFSSRKSQLLGAFESYR